MKSRASTGPRLMRLSPERVAQLEQLAKKTKPLVTFADLKIGERFGFKNKSTVACGKYNGDFTKTSDGTYRGQCFTGYPDPSVEVVACPLGADWPLASNLIKTK